MLNVEQYLRLFFETDVEVDSSKQKERQIKALEEMKISPTLDNAQEYQLLFQLSQNLPKNSEDKIFMNRAIRDYTDESSSLTDAQKFVVKDNLSQQLDEKRLVARRPVTTFKLYDGANEPFESEKALSVKDFTSFGVFGEIPLKTSLKETIFRPFRPFQENPLSKIIIPKEIDMEERAALEYMNTIKTFFRDPKKVSGGLRNFDRQIAERMGWNSDASTNINELLEGDTGLYYPALPVGYLPMKKEHVVDTLLSQNERAQGIPEGAFFEGFLNPRDAKKFQNERLFKETPQIGRLLFHGKNSHRLHFEILRQWDTSEEGLPFPKKRNGEKVSGKELLQLFMARTPQSTFPNVWNSTIDNIEDQEERRQNRGRNGVSMLSPFELNSTLICFGSDLGVPNLQRALADSHFKQVAQMCDRYVRCLDECSPETLESLARTYQISPKEIKDNSVPYLHDRLILATESVGHHTKSIGFVGNYMPWIVYGGSGKLALGESTVSPKERSFADREAEGHHARYERFSDRYALSIVKKKSSSLVRTKSDKRDRYESWKEYRDIKEKKNLYQTR